MVFKSEVPLGGFSIRAQGMCVGLFEGKGKVEDIAEVGFAQCSRIPLHSLGKKILERDCPLDPWTEEIHLEIDLTGDAFDLGRVGSRFAQEVLFVSLGDIGKFHDVIEGGFQQEPAFLSSEERFLTELFIGESPDLDAFFFFVDFPDRIQVALRIAKVFFKNAREGILNSNLSGAVGFNPDFFLSFDDAGLKEEGGDEK